MLEDPQALLNALLAALNSLLTSLDTLQAALDRAQNVQGFAGQIVPVNHAALQVSRQMCLVQVRTRSGTRLQILTDSAGTHHRIEAGMLSLTLHAVRLGALRVGAQRPVCQRLIHQQNIRNGGGTHVELPVADHRQGLVVETDQLVQAAAVENANRHGTVRAEQELQTDAGQAVVENTFLVHLELAVGVLAFVPLHNAGGAHERAAFFERRDGAFQELGCPQVVVIVNRHVLGGGRRQTGVGCRLHVVAGGGQQLHAVGTQRGSLNDGAGCLLVASIVNHTDRVVGEGLLRNVLQRAAQEAGAALRADQNSYGRGRHNHNQSRVSGPVPAQELNPL